MNEDTIQLLEECNMGCKTATNSMEQVLPFTKDTDLKAIIEKYNDIHISIGDQCHEILNSSNEKEKDPPMTAKTFSWINTEIKLMVNDNNHKIADIMIDGCNMGIKSLSKYLNQYKAASEESINLVKNLIQIEQDFMKELLLFL